jgi:hypothetical protein
VSYLPPIFQQNSQYSARVTRQLLTDIATEGVVDGASFAVTERAAGANMSVDVAAGRAYISGTDQSNQGLYLCITEQTVNVIVEPADPSLGRIDLVVAQVRDPNAGGIAGDDWQFTVLEGTPDASPVAPSLPASSIPLAEIAVGAGVTSILDVDLTDLRTFSSTPVRADLDDLSDVDAPSPSTGDVLVYDGVAGEWQSSAVGFRYVGTRYYTSSGTFAKADPFGDSSFDGAKMRAIRVRLVGAGGGGGGAPATAAGETGLSPSGGGGGYAESFITDIAGLDASVTVTRGAGGNGGAAGANAGSNGGASSFGALVAANGGGGGGAGFATSTFPKAVSGADGGAATAGTLQANGGAATAGVMLTGSLSGAPDGSAVGTAGGSVLSAGRRTAVFANGAAGVLGSGGTGSLQTSSAAAKSGGAGGDGIVIVDVFA